MMKWNEIDPMLQRRACEVMGYDVRQPAQTGLISFAVLGWFFRSPEGYVEPGYSCEEEAWAGAFHHLCKLRVIYRHKKGGIYMSLCGGKSTDDGELVMIYHHLAPHEPGVWVRKLDEFDEEGRFVHVTG